MTALLCCTAGLVVVGTLTTGLDALTRKSCPLSIFIGRLLCCAAGTLAAMEATIAGIRLIAGDSQGAATTSPTLQLISGMCVAAAAIVLLHLHGGLPGVHSRSMEARLDEKP